VAMKLDISVARSIVDRITSRASNFCHRREATSQQHEDARGSTDFAEPLNRAGLVKTFAVISKLAQTESK